MASSPTLRADVYVSSQLPIGVDRNGQTSSWSPISCTLIHGKSEAVLVDTPISIAQTEDLIRWIEGVIPGKQLTYVYITHGHGDHFFGLPVLRKRWPNLRAVATPGTIAHMKQQLESPWMNDIWLKYFPGGQIALPAEVAEPLGSDTINLEGHMLRVHEVGHTDTYDTTVLHVPELDLVVAGDVVYGDVHQFFGEADTPAKRQEWLAAIEKIESLKPKAVVAGHKRPGSVDGVYYLQSTKEYIRSFEEVAGSSSSPKEIFSRMKSLYPDRVNPHAILAGAAAAFKSKQLELKSKV